MPLLGGLAIPADGFRVVLRHALAVGMHSAEVVLRVGVPLLGGTAKPASSFRIILRHALTFVVHDAEVVLRSGVPLLGGTAKPASSFRMILRHALVVREAEGGLRRGVPLLGKRPEQLHGCGVVPTFISLRNCLPVLSGRGRKGQDQKRERQEKGANCWKPLKDGPKKGPHGNGRRHEGNNEARRIHISRLRAPRRYT